MYPPEKPFQFACKPNNSTLDPVASLIHYNAFAALTIALFSGYRFLTASTTLTGPVWFCSDKAMLYLTNTEIFLFVCFDRICHW